MQVNLRQGLFSHFIAFINGIMFNIQKNIQNPKDKKKEKQI